MTVLKSGDKSLVGLAGEYHVLAQLPERGLVGALTLGHTKGVDILVADPTTGAVSKLKVKTSRKPPGRSPLFGEGRFFSWQLSVKHEKPLPVGWFYCFVWLPGSGLIPRFFITTAAKVAAYVRWEHRHWLKSHVNVRDNPMRQLRIPVADPEGFENNWSALFSHHTV